MPIIKMHAAFKKIQRFILHLDNSHYLTSSILIELKLRKKEKIKLKAMIYFIALSAMLLVTQLANKKS